MRRRIVLISLLSFALCFVCAPAGSPLASRALMDYAPIVLDGGPSREVILANGQAAHFSCETADHNLRAYHGLYVRMHEFLDSWTFTVAGEAYDPREAVSVTVHPYALTRVYPDGTRETVFLPRYSAPSGSNALVITLRPAGSGLTVFEPRVDFRFIWDVPRPDYWTEWNERLGALFIEREDFTPPAGVPSMMAILPESWAEWIEGGRRESTRYPRDAARQAMAQTHPYVPGRLEFDVESGRAFRLVVALGDSQNDAFSSARHLLANDEAIQLMTARHYETLTLGVPQTGGARMDSTLHWARWSLDNLTMNARGPGIYAGYHWFTNYWGRDSFISLPGACLVHGDFERARSILESFASHQLAEGASGRLGRLPNIVNPDDLQYAGVDGTWWWVRAARLYLDATGDREFLAAAWPVVRKAVTGALQKAVDEHGLLKHGDGETWMDAGGEANPYSPRGDRAVEVQVLWWDGLRTATLMARWAGHLQDAQRYEELADKTLTAIRELFGRDDGQGFADHLNADGSRDLQIRPNQIFALTLPRRAHLEEGPQLWWGEKLTGEILDATMTGCVLPHGVTSLAPGDPDWKGRHLALDRYYYDAAYHNGDVWLWLSGPVIQALCDAGRQDEAWTLLSPLVSDLLDRGAVGTLREIRDGEKRVLEDYGGATSQAWSLAEFLRVYYEAFLGFHPRAMERSVDFQPRLPRSMKALDAQVRFADHDWRVQVGREGFNLIPLGESTLDSDPSSTPDLTELWEQAELDEADKRKQKPETWTVNIRLPNGKLSSRRIQVPAAQPLGWFW